MIIFLGIIILFSSAMETIAFGSVLPFLAFILEPGKIEGNKYYQYLFSFLKSPSRETMTYFLCALSLSLLILSNILTIIVNHIIALFSASCWKRISSDLIKECIETPYEWFLSKNSALVTRLFHSDLELWSRESINLILTIFSEFVILIFLSLMVVSVFPAEGFGQLFYHFS